MDFSKPRRFSLRVARYVGQVVRQLLRPHPDLVEAAADDALPSEFGSAALWLKGLLLGVAYLGLAWVGISLTQMGGAIATIWLANGLAIGVIATHHKNDWPLYFGFVAAANLAGNLLGGNSLLMSAGFLIANLCEIGIAVWAAAYFHVWSRNALQLRSLFHLVLWVSFVPCLISGVIGWLIVGMGNVPIRLFLAFWMTADGLGILIVGTFVAGVSTTPWRALRRDMVFRNVLGYFVLVVTTTYVFAQGRYAHLYMVAPSLLYVVFSAGRHGAAFGVLIVMFIAAPFTLNGSGPISLASVESGAGVVALLQLFLITLYLTALPVAIVLADRSQLQRSLRENNRVLSRLATTDSLTGAMNRRAFEEQLANAVEASKRTHKPTSLIILDVDHFKLYNDTYGHPAGDRVLRSLVMELSDVMSRWQDVVARYGGEEFAVVLPQTDTKAAIDLANKAREAFMNEAIEHRRSAFGVCTVSMGVATTDGLDVLTRPTDILQAADCALYMAKRKGRNCAVHLDIAQQSLPAEMSHRSGDAIIT